MLDRTERRDDLQRNVLPGTLVQNLLNLLSGYRQFIHMVAQPLGEIPFDDFTPAGVDLPGGILPFLQSTVAEHVAETHHL